MTKLTAPVVAARLKSPRAQGQARALRKQMTPAEKGLWKLLRQHTLRDSHWRKQCAVGPFIVDFACHGARVIVELDGGVHDMDDKVRAKERQDFLEGRGYRVLRFTNSEVAADVGSVVRTILKCDLRPSPLAGEGRVGGDGDAVAE